MISIVLGSLNVGGSERQASYLVNYLTSRKIPVQVVGFSSPGKISELIKPSPYVHIASIGMGNKYLAQIMNTLGLSFYFYFVNLLFIFFKNKPNLVISYTHMPNVVSALASKVVGAKFVWNQRDSGSYSFFNLWTKIAVRLTDLFISNSEGGKDYMIEKFHIKRHSIKVISNGVVIPKVSYNFAHEFTHRFRKSRLVIMLANITQTKDHRTLIYSWKIVCQHLPDAKLLLVGYKGDAFLSTKQLVSQLHLDDKVIFVGSRADTTELISQCSVAVFSSLSEGLPNGILEPMSLGLPVVATDIRGSREIFGNNYPLLAPPFNEKILAEKIITVLSNHSLRKKGVNCKKTIINKYSMEKMTNSYTKIINKLI